MTDDVMDRATLLALTPEKYLAGGFLDEDGQMRPELVGEWATASAMRLSEAGVPAKELEFTYEALRQTLPLHSGRPSARYWKALTEALEVIGQMQPSQGNHPALASWLADCAFAIQDDAHLEALLVHCQAVVRQFGLIRALRIRKLNNLDYCRQAHQISLRIGHTVIPPEMTGWPYIATVVHEYNRSAALEGLPDELNPTLLDPAKVAAFIEGLCRLPEEALAKIHRTVLYLNASGLPLSQADPVAVEALRAGWQLESPASEPGQLIQPTIRPAMDVALAAARAERARTATQAYDEEVKALAAELDQMDTGVPEYGQALRRLSTLKSKRFYAATAWRNNSRALSQADPADADLAAETERAEAAVLAFVAPPRSGMPGGGAPG